MQKILGSVRNFFFHVVSHNAEQFSNSNISANLKKNQNHSKLLSGGPNEWFNEKTEVKNLVKLSL